MKNRRRARPRVVAICLAALCLAAGWLGGAEYGSAPPELLRGPTVNKSDRDLDLRAWSTGRDGIWIQPGVRNLDALVFGTVAEPLGAEFMIGVPLYDRLDDGLGNWTTTALPGPASNQTAALGAGSYASIAVHDRTPRDLPSFSAITHDEVDLYVRAHHPSGQLVEITATTALPKGPFHEFFGGVGTNLIQHGRTGLGGKSVPQVFSYITVYALGEIRINGQLLPGNDNQLVHCMVSEGFRDPANSPGPAGGTGPFLASNAEVDRDDLEFHVLMPGVRFMPNPMPNQPIFGVGQQFVHLVFESTELQGTGIRGILKR